MKKNLFVVSAYILAIAMIANNLSPLNVFAKQSDETCTTCSISDNSNDNGKNIEDYIEQYKQYDNEEESNIVQTVLNSSYYSEIENIITSNPNIYNKICSIYIELGYSSDMYSFSPNGLICDYIERKINKLKDNCIGTKCI